MKRLLLALLLVASAHAQLIPSQASSSGGGGSVTQGTVPWVVSGTVTANQGGTWTVQPGNTANTTPWLVSASQSGSWTVTANAGSGTFAFSSSQLPAALDGSGFLKVHEQGTATVSGTVAATQSGTWNVNATQSGTWTVTGAGGTFPVTQSTSPWVVSGSVTANAGTNLNTSALALDATLAKLTLAQGSTTSGQTGALLLGAVTTAAPTYTTGQTSPFSLTTGGLLRVDGSGVTQPVNGTVTANAGTGTFNIQSNASVNLAQAAGNTLLTGNGVTGTGSPRVTIASDNTAFTVNAAQSGNWTSRIVGNGGATLDSTIGAATAPTNAVATSGVFQTTTPAPTAGQAVAMQIDSSASHLVSLEGRKNSYRASKSFTCVAGDVAVMPGSASKTIKVTRALVNLRTSGTAAFSTLQFIKRSAADTAGTSAAMTAVPLDSNDAAATAAPLNYTAAPTPGAAVGPISSYEILNESASSNQAPFLVEAFSTGSGIQPVVLRGTAQQLAVNFSAIVATGTCSVTFEWSEE